MISALPNIVKELMWMSLLSLSGCCYRLNHHKEESLPWLGSKEQRSEANQPVLYRISQSTNLEKPSFFSLLPITARSLWPLRLPLNLICLWLFWTGESIYKAFGGTRFSLLWSLENGTLQQCQRSQLRTSAHHCVCVLYTGCVKCLKSHGLTCGSF